MALEIVTLIKCELSQTEEDKYHMKSLICIILNDTNTPISHGSGDEKSKIKVSADLCLLRPRSGGGHLPSP